MAMRLYMRGKHVEGNPDPEVLKGVGLTVAQVEDMYRYLAIANYEDRFVIPTSHRELATDAFPERGGCGFSFGDGCHGESEPSLFNGQSTTSTLVKPVDVFDPKANAPAKIKEVQHD
jgi:nitrate reductase beta subunit